MGGGGAAVAQLQWFYLEVDNSDAADPVKQRGPFSADDMADLWRSTKIDEETYVWADGMADFQQVKQMSDLKGFLANPQSEMKQKQSPEKPVSTPAMSTAVASAETPGAVGDIKTSTWYYKNAQGVKLGPSVLDTLKIMWDFGEIDENTLVMQEGMTEFLPVKGVTSLYTALTTSKASLKMPPLPTASPEPDKEEDDITTRDVPLSAKGAPMTAGPVGSIQDLLDEVDEDVKQKVASAKKNEMPRVDLESDDFWDESESDDLRFRSKLDSTRSERERRKNKDDKKIKSRRKYDDRKQSLNRASLGSDGMRTSGTTFAKKVDGNQLNSIFNLFQEQMSTLETEYNRARDTLQAEYEEEYDALNDAIEEEKLRYRHIKEKGRDIKNMLDNERAIIAKEKANFLAIREKVVGERTKTEAELEAERIRINEDRAKLIREMEDKEKALRAEAQRLEEERKRFNKQVDDLENAKNELERQKSQLQKEGKALSSNVDLERESLNSDIREFETYKAEVEQLLETKQMIIKEEKEEFIKTRAQELQVISAKQSELDVEVSRAAEIRTEIESEKNRSELDWNQRGNYLDIHQKQLEEERRQFDEEKAEHERTMEAERLRIKEQIKAVERFQDANASLIEDDKKKLIHERDRLVKDLEIERKHMEAERIESARKIYELGVQVKSFQEMPSTTSAALMQQQIGAASVVGGGGFITPATFTRPMPTPAQAVSAQAAGKTPGGGGGLDISRMMQSPAAGTSSASPMMGKLQSIRVFVGTAEDRNLLGEIALGPSITLGDLRRMIQAQFRLTPGFSLKKKKIPIRPSQDHHRAHDFLKTVDDYLVVE